MRNAFTKHPSKPQLETSRRNQTSSFCSGRKNNLTVPTRTSDTAVLKPFLLLRILLCICYAPETRWLSRCTGYATKTKIWVRFHAVAISIFFSIASRRDPMHNQRQQRSASQELKWPGREADHLPLSRAGVNNARRYTSNSPYVFMDWCLINSAQ
jgi:hypothetical protein